MVRTLGDVRRFRCIAAIYLLMVGTEASGQAAQPFSFQLSALKTSIGVGASSSGVGGYGVEPQIRANGLFAKEGRGSFSFGAGVQWTTHAAGVDELTISGVFFEPRWLIPGSILGTYAYLSGRLALLRQSSNFGSASTGNAYGLGGGLAYPLAKRVNFDAGVAFVHQKFGDFEMNDAAHTPLSFNAFNTYALKVGLSYGFP